MFDGIVGPYARPGWVLEYWPVLAVAFVFSLAGTWLFKQVAMRLGIVDVPDDTVKTHGRRTAYLGGLGMFVGVAAAVVTGLVILGNGGHFVRQWRVLVGVLAGATIACGIGLLDDIKDIKPWQKIAGQLVASMALVAAGILPTLRYFTEPFGIVPPGWLEIVIGVPIVVIFVLGATNSLNLLDGLDGLCAGVTVIITGAFLLLTIHLATWGFSEIGDPVRAIVCLGLVGASLGFLPFNRHPAVIFMGDAGSMLLGFLIATLMLLFAEKYPRWWLASIVAFGLPIMDTATAFVRRWLNHRPIFVSDRGHLYDQMIDRGLSLHKTVFVSYLLAAVYAVIALLMSQIRTRYSIFIYIAVFAASGIVVWKMGFLEMEGLRGKRKKVQSDESVKAGQEK